MSETIYRFTDAVEAACKNERARLKRCRDQGLISTDQAMKLYMEFLRKNLYASRTEHDPDRTIGVECRGCKARHFMPASVKRFTCKCSPRVERPTAFSRVPLV